jgi:hypothetical protein
LEPYPITLLFSVRAVGGRSWMELECDVKLLTCLQTVLCSVITRALFYGPDWHQVHKLRIDQKPDLIGSVS